jgi:uncharacterized protein (UPF0333 family)
MRNLTASLAFCVMAIVIAIGFFGCNDFERTTYQTLSASKATIDQIAADYNAGKIKETPAAFKAITDLRAAQTVAVNAMVEYETIKAAKGSQSALQAQQSIVANALAALPPLIVSAKALYTSLSSSSVQNAPRPAMQPIAAQ